MSIVSWGCDRCGTRYRTHVDIHYRTHALRCVMCKGTRAERSVTLRKSERCRWVEPCTCGSAKAISLARANGAGASRLIGTVLLERACRFGCARCVPDALSIVATALRESGDDAIRCAACDTVRERACFSAWEESWQSWSRRCKLCEWIVRVCCASESCE